MRDQGNFSHMAKVSCKLILLFLVGIARNPEGTWNNRFATVRHAQSTQNNKLAISLQCLKKERRDEVVFFACRWISKFPACCTINVGGHGELSTKIRSLQNLCNISRMKWGIKLVFSADKHKVFYKLIVSHLMGITSHP